MIIIISSSVCMSVIHTAHIITSIPPHHWHTSWRNTILCHSGMNTVETVEWRMEHVKHKKCNIQTRSLIHTHTAFKITVSYRPFSDQNWSLVEVFRLYFQSFIQWIHKITWNGHINLWMPKHCKVLAISPYTFHWLFWTAHTSCHII